jgi:tetratricopeptide (TPR) repeat protein
VISLAIEKFERAAGFFPKDRDVQCFLADAMMVLGLFEERFELLKEARLKIEAALLHNPNDASTLFLYGTCLVHLGKYFDDENLIRQSFEKFEKSIEIAPEDPHVWHSLALAHFTYGDMTEDPIMLEKAIRLFEVTQKKLHRPDSELFNNWGVALMKLSEVTGDLLNVQVAADKFEQAIAHHQDTRQGRDPDPEWYYNYGCALDYLGDFYQDPGFYEKGAQVLTHLVNTFPNYAQARYNLALALIHLGDALGEIECIERALTHLEILLNEDPEDEIILGDTGYAYLVLGEITQGVDSPMQAKDLFVQAEAKLLQATALGHKGAFFWLACLYSLTQAIPECVHYLERARDEEVLPLREHLLEEKWLDVIRRSDHWEPFFKTLPPDPI